MIQPDPTRPAGDKSSFQAASTLSKTDHLLYQQPLGHGQQQGSTIALPIDPFGGPIYANQAFTTSLSQNQSWPIDMMAMETGPTDLFGNFSAQDLSEDILFGVMRNDWT